MTMYDSLQLCRQQLIKTSASVHNPDCLVPLNKVVSQMPFFNFTRAVIIFYLMFGFIF
jgi:hypothetical protein